MELSSRLTYVVPDFLFNRNSLWIFKAAQPLSLFERFFLFLRLFPVLNLLITCSWQTQQLSVLLFYVHTPFYFFMCSPFDGILVIKAFISSAAPRNSRFTFHCFPSLKFPRLIHLHLMTSQVIGSTTAKFW